MPGQALLACGLFHSGHFCDRMDLTLCSGRLRRRSIHQTGLAILIAASLLAGTTTASAAHPTTHVYVLLGGVVGRDGYLDSRWMLVLAARIAQIPHTVVESYTWADWVSAANSIWALPSENTKVVVVGYSGGGSRATWLANSILNKTIDLIVT
jgi:hypothetical protein